MGEMGWGRPAPWNADPENTSLNHYALGSVGQWLYFDLAGIQAGSPGFKEIIIRPLMITDSITNIQASYDSIYGKIISRWETDGPTLKMDITIPHDTTARVHIPSGSPSDKTESGKPVDEVKGITSITGYDDMTLIHLGSGNCRFEIVLPDSAAIKVPDESELTAIDHRWDVARR